MTRQPSTAGEREGGPVGAGDLLQRLDRRLLPPLARGMARLGQGPVRLRVLTGTALLSSVAVLVTAVWAAERRPQGDPTVGEVTRVGVVEGQSVPGYVASSRTELAALLAAPRTGPPPQVYALVTLAGYLAPDRLGPVLAEVTVSEVFSRVPLPETQTQIVRIPAFRIPEDVIGGMLLIAERKDQEARDYVARGARLTGHGEREQGLRALYVSGARVAQAEATAYRSRCSCVYAAVVRGTPDALDRVAVRPGVRAVDPAPEVRRLDRAVFSPPLPEQDDLVRPPADATLPVDGGSPDPVSPDPTSPDSSPSGSPPDPTATPSPDGTSPSPVPTESPSVVIPTVAPDEPTSPTPGDPPATPPEETPSAVP